MTPSLYGRGYGVCGFWSASKLPVLGLIGMEQVWNRGGATAGKRSVFERHEIGLNWRKTVASGCHRLPGRQHGKQGVCGGLPPLAGGPLSVKEGVDVLLGSTVRGYFLLQSGHGH
jgi:hypothetical protein